METKFLSLILLTAILLSATATASVGFTTSTTSIVFTQLTDTQDFTVTNTGNETLAFTLPTSIVFSDGTNQASVTLDKYTFNLAEGASETVSASVDSEDIGALETGIYSYNLDVNAASISSEENLTKTITLEAKKSYCELGPVNESVIQIRDVDESGSSESDDWTWRPQDKITLSIKIENNDNDNDREIRVEWDIYDKEEEEFLDVGDDDTVDVNEDDSEWIDFTFDVPYDLERGARYVLYIKAFDDDDGEDEICTVVGDNGRSAGLRDEEGIPLKIERERNEVVVSKTEIPSLITCGSTADIQLWIANTGREREDKVKVTLLSSVFGAETSREISKLDWDDRAEKVTFPVTIPKDLAEGDYPLKFRIDFEYDEDDDSYGTFITPSYTIEVSGNCQAKSESGAIITAVLDSEAIEGQELVIKGTLENTGNERNTYLLSVLDYNSWASLDKIEPKTITLDEGDSEDFFIYLKVNEDSAGEQFLTIRTDFGEQNEEQEVSVLIEKVGTTPVTGSVIADNLRENWFIWLIVVINIILIIAIILVARRIVTSK